MGPAAHVLSLSLLFSSPLSQPAVAGRLPVSFRFGGWDRVPD
jgi:hypothetical protein